MGAESWLKFSLFHLHLIKLDSQTVSVTQVEAAGGLEGAAAHSIRAGLQALKTDAVKAGIADPAGSDATWEAYLDVLQTAYEMLACDKASSVAVANEPGSLRAGDCLLQQRSGHARRGSIQSSWQPRLAA